MGRHHRARRIRRDDPHRQVRDGLDRVESPRFQEDILENGCEPNSHAVEPPLDRTPVQQDKREEEAPVLQRTRGDVAPQGDGAEVGHLGLPAHNLEHHALCHRLHLLRFREPARARKSLHVVV